MTMRYRALAAAAAVAAMIALPACTVAGHHATGNAPGNAPPAVAQHTAAAAKPMPAGCTLVLAMIPIRPPADSDSAMNLSAFLGNMPGSALQMVKHGTLLWHLTAQLDATTFKLSEDMSESPGNVHNDLATYNDQVNQVKGYCKPS
jgi:hypothetical protein